MTLNELRVAFQDEIHSRWVAAHPSAPVYFENARVNPDRTPYLLSRVEYGGERRADLATSSKMHRLIGVLIFILKTTPDTSNGDHDAYLETIRTMNHDQAFRPAGVLTRGANISGSGTSGDLRTTVMTIPFQVDSFV